MLSHVVLDLDLVATQMVVSEEDPIAPRSEQRARAERCRSPSWYAVLMTIESGD